MNPRLILEIVAGLALFGGVLWYNHHERSIGAEQCHVDQEIQAKKDEADGQKVVAEARALAAEDVAEHAKEEARKEKEQADFLRGEANLAHAKAQDLQRRYEAQLVADKSCAAWSQEKVACALQ